MVNKKRYIFEAVDEMNPLDFHTPQGAVTIYKGPGPRREVKDVIFSD